MSTNEMTKLTIDGETREVEIRVFEDGKRAYTVKRCGIYQKRQGQKLWPDAVWFWKIEDGSWKAATVTTILNRYGYRLIKWNDGEAAHRSQHNSAGR